MPYHVQYTTIFHCFTLVKLVLFGDSMAKLYTICMLYIVYVGLPWKHTGMSHCNNNARSVCPCLRVLLSEVRIIIKRTCMSAYTSLTVLDVY